MGFFDSLNNFLFGQGQEMQPQEDGDYTKRKSLLTDTELEFYKLLEKLFSEYYKVQAQVSLRSVVSKTIYSKYINELFKDIDFGIFDKETLKPLVLIELNDKSHKNADRYERDLKVRDILKQAGIPLLTFYVGMPNEKDYVYKRIHDELKKYKTGIFAKYLTKKTN